MSSVIYHRRSGSIVPRILPVGVKLLFDIEPLNNYPTSGTHTILHLDHMINCSPRLKQLE